MRIAKALPLRACFEGAYVIGVEQPFVVSLSLVPWGQDDHSPGIYACVDLAASCQWHPGALAINPRSAAAHYNLGAFLAAQRQTALAEEHYRIAARRGPPGSIAGQKASPLASAAAET